MSKTNLQVHELATGGSPMCLGWQNMRGRMRNVVHAEGLVGDSAVFALARAHSMGMKAQFLKAHASKGEPFQTSS